MLWMINCRDKPGTTELREKNLPEHRKYLEGRAEQIFFSGPHLDDVGQTMIGSVFIISAASRSEAEQFIQNETLYRTGLFSDVSITRIRKGRLLPELAALP